jgi:hypothetical protein
MNIWTCKRCVQSGCRMCSQSIKTTGYDLEQCLAIFKRYKDEFFRRYITITIDVTWLLQNIPGSNRQSAEWAERDEPNPKRGKTPRSAGISITGYAWYYFHRLPRKGPDHQQQILQSVIGERLNDEIKKNGPI